MLDNRSYIEIKYAAIIRKLLWLNSARFDVKLIAEFPKSGGTWLTQMMSELTDLHYFRNTTPKFQSCILHGHHTFNKRFNKPIYVARDYRDVIVSYYHHLLLGEFISEKERKINQKKIEISNPMDVVKNLPKFIDFLENHKKINFVYVNWAYMTNSYLNSYEKALIIRYEDLIDDPFNSIKSCLDFWEITKGKQEILKVISKYNFQNLTNRKIGHSKKGQFLRKGGYGDYKNYFNDDLNEMIYTKHQTLFKALGYEK